MQTPRSVDELADIIRHAAAHDTPLRLQGAGTWLGGHGPFVASSPVSLAAIAGIVHYEPGDLVVTARAGTSLAELAEATQAHGQMLALAPYGSPDSTIGAVIATATAGPLTLGDLTVRDLVLGVTTVTGTGETVHAGGRVVKNVAGFDLVRLHTGACGTLGAITEVTVRLHAIPAVDAVVVGTLEQDLAHTLPTLVANRAPLPMQVVCAPNAAPELWARVSGNRARATALTQRLGALGVTALSHVENSAPLRVTPPNAVVLRARAALSDAVPFVIAAREIFSDGTLHYDVARGALRIIAPLRSALECATRIAHLHEVVRQRGAAHAISVIIDQGRTQPAAPSPLDAGMKHALDPRDILNRRAARSSV